MKIFQIDGNVYGFEEDGTAYIFSDGTNMWYRVCGPPNAPAPDMEIKHEIKIASAERAR